MKLNRTPILKALLAIVPVLLLAAVLPSVIALAVGSAKVTYTTDGNGTITSGSEETVEITETYWVDYTSDQRDAAKIGGAQAEPHTDYKLAYWTTDKNVYYLSADAYDNLVTISAGTQIEKLDERDYYVSEDTVFTAHFESTATTSYTVTYTVDENGEAFDEDKASESVEEGSSPTNVPEPVAKDATKYMFAYWTADADVTLTDGTTITTGNKITTDQLKQVKVTSAITFTANFKRIVTVTYAIDGDGYFPAGSATTEDVPMGNCLTNIPTPLSSSDDVVFAYWSTNKKIEFTDGSSKGSGERITAAQLKRGMIGQTMTLTAHFTNRTYTMTYATDANGYFDTTAATTEIVGLYGAPVNVPTPLAKDPDNYVFGYWIADSNVLFDENVTIAKGNPLTTAQIKEAKISFDLTFTAIFREARHTVTYEVDENGEFPTGTGEPEVVADNASPANIPTPSPKNADKYVFGYWTADVKTTYSDGTSIDANKKISIEQLPKLLVTENITLTAHLRELTHTVTYLQGTKGHFEDKTSPYTEVVNDLASPASIPSPVTDVVAYPFTYWVADDDVVLTDGTAIKKNAAITSEQLAKVVVDQDITFTATYVMTAYSNVTFNTDGRGSFEGHTEPDPKVSFVVYKGEYLGYLKTYPYDAAKYAFDYWVSDATLSFITRTGQGQAWGQSYPAGYHLSNYDLSIGTFNNGSYSGENITITAHFKQLYGDITYAAGDNGKVSVSSEQVNFSSKTIDNESVMVGSLTGADPIPEAGFEFDHWEASEDVYNATDLSTIEKGEHLTTEQLKGGILVSKDTKFTAYFKQMKANVTYTSAGNGSVSSDSETVGLSKQSSEMVAGIVKGSTPKAAEGCIFDYWETDVDVYTYDPNTSQWVKHQAGTQIKTADLSSIWVTQDTKFTAHFTRVYTFTYKAGPHGSVSPTTEVVRADDTPAGPNISPDAGYAFDHWTADKDVEVADATQAIMLTGSEDDVAPQAGTTTIQAGDPITAEQFALIVPTTDATFTANFVRVPPFTVSYTTDGNGSVADESETIENAFDSPAGTEVTANKGFEFDYWTASTDVQIPGEEGGDPVTIAKGEKITDEQLKQVLVTDDITFTAHFKQTAVDPDGGDTIKPADGEGGKLTPKTGDTLPGATAAVALGAGVVVAGVVLLKKRHQ